MRSMMLRLFCRDGIF